jgi:hypothetical protein
MMVKFCVCHPKGSACCVECRGRARPAPTRPWGRFLSFPADMGADCFFLFLREMRKLNSIKMIVTIVLSELHAHAEEPGEFFFAEHFLLRAIGKNAPFSEQHHALDLGNNF